MKIKLTKGKIAPEAAIHAVETVLGFRFSSSFCSFLRYNDGATPDTNTFKIGKDNNAGVNEFIPLNQIAEERKFISNLPKYAYPVAWAECGNYVFIDEGKDGAVFFWNHEEPEEITELTPNFRKFLDILEPHSVKDVKLKPGQVESVWVHPDLLKRIKK